MLLTNSSIASYTPSALNVYEEKVVVATVYYNGVGSACPALYTDLTFSRIGKVVFFKITGNTATSTSTTSVIVTAAGAVPARFAPTATWQAAISVQDNGIVTTWGVITVAADGTVSLYKDTLKATNFMSGTSGGVVNDHHFSYQV